MPEVAVFPLPLVVFPGMTVPLHVFEARYKRLVKHAESLDPPRFVIAPPTSETMDEEGTPRPGAVGTLVDLVDVTENADGTFTIIGHGRERCRLTYERVERVAEGNGSQRPLWFAEVERWPVERGDPNEERLAAWDALEAFERYGEMFFAPSAQAQAKDSIPEDPLYQASFVCANLRLPAERAQDLLEAQSLVERFAKAQVAIEQRIEERQAEETLGASGEA